MTQRFRYLAIFLTFMMVLTIAVGFWSFFLEVSPFKKDVFIAHFYLGLFTTLVILLVHCLIFTYFLGTGRWVKEVGIAYKLNDEEQPKTTRELKRIVFPPALFSMLIAIAASAAGAGVQLQAWHWSVHATLAFFTLAINVWAFRVELWTLELNARTIQEVLDEVDRRRAELGLSSNAEELAK